MKITMTQLRTMVQEEINKIIDEFEGDPESLAREMSRKFGVTYVPRS